MSVTYTISLPVNSTNVGALGSLSPYLYCDLNGNRGPVIISVVVVVVVVYKTHLS